MSIVIAMLECPRRSCTIFGWHVLSKHVRGVAMPHAVEAHRLPLCLQEVGNRVCEAPGLVATTIGLSNYVSIVVRSNVEPQEFLRLSQLPGLQRFDKHRQHPVSDPQAR